jgi:hypothetical protein
MFPLEAGMRHESCIPDTDSATRRDRIRRVGNPGSNPRLGWICALAVLTWVAPAQAMPAAEEAKSQALIARVEAASGAVFIRNGTEYSAAHAAEFLRRKCAGKWEHMASAREFIASCASMSGTSGKPYMIQLKGGNARPSAQVLGEWLAEMERGPR